tara:strand:- start:2892 stop:2999 length:108 start_codon:yes stop_codon:yes gene_type:complete
MNKVDNNNTEDNIDIPAEQQEFTFTYINSEDLNGD